MSKLQINCITQETPPPGYVVAAALFGRSIEKLAEDIARNIGGKYSSVFTRQEEQNETTSDN